MTVMDRILGRKQNTVAAPLFHMTTRSYDDRTIHICGRTGDPYYDSIAGDHTNDEFDRLLSKTLQPGSVVLDVGANVGFMAAIAASHGATVYSFEPSPSVYPCLVETTKANLPNKINPVQMAVGSEIGSIGFFDYAFSASVSHVESRGTLSDNPSNMSVPMTTLDVFVKEKGIYRVDLIKIDVEGFELDVLKGALETISEMKPAAFVEFNSFTMIAFRDINPRVLLGLLLETFPYVYSLGGEGIKLVRNETEQRVFLHGNLVLHGCVDDLYCSFKPLA